MMQGTSHNMWRTQSTTHDASTRGAGHGETPLPIRSRLRCRYGGACCRWVAGLTEANPMKRKTALAGILTTFALLAILGVGLLTAGGCISRADWESGLDQAQTISDTLSDEIGSVRQLIADLQQELASEEPGSAVAVQLRDLLDQAQERLSILHQQKAPVDAKILEYRQRLAEVPEGASDLDTTLYMAKKGWDDIEGFLPIPEPFKEGIAVAAVGLAYYLRRKFAAVRAERDQVTEIATGVVRSVEEGKKANPRLAEEMDNAGPTIRLAQGPAVQQFVSKVRKGA